jgi:hypothetical protein
LPVFSRQVFPPLSNILDYILFHFRLKSFTYQVKSIKDLTGNIYSFVKQLFLAMENKTTGLLTHLLLLFLKNFFALFKSGFIGSGKNELPFKTSSVMQYWLLYGGKPAGFVGILSILLYHHFFN